jgi:uncharacterized protein (UPF0218 family)
MSEDAKIIQMVKTSDDNYLILYGFNDKGELVFRSSRNFKHLQSEKIVIEDHIVYTNLYFFHESFLEKIKDIKL